MEEISRPSFGKYPIYYLSDIQFVEYSGNYAKVTYQIRLDIHLHAASLLGSARQMSLKNLSYINHRLIPDYWMRSAECGVDASEDSISEFFRDAASRPCWPRPTGRSQRRAGLVI